MIASAVILARLEASFFIAISSAICFVCASCASVARFTFAVNLFISRCSSARVFDVPSNFEATCPSALISLLMPASLGPDCPDCPAAPIPLVPLRVRTKSRNWSIISCI